MKIDFYNKEENDKRIAELEQQVSSLQDSLKFAKEDIKRMMHRDYGVICEFCIHSDCCYIMSGYMCKKKMKWRGEL